jgi:hypothetical protein
MFAPSRPGKAIVPGPRNERLDRTAYLFADSCPSFGRGGPTGRRITGITDTQTDASMLSRLVWESRVLGGRSGGRVRV